MKRVLVCAALAVTLAAPAFAGTFDVLVANTLTLTDTRGGVYTILLSADGKLEQVNSAGTWAAGSWRKDADRGDKGLCWAARGQATLCIPIPDDKGVGDTWEIRGPTGQLSWTAEIVEGRVDLKPAASEP